MESRAAAPVAEPGEPLARTVGIVVVHGVIPHPRYQIQDQCAKALTGELNGDQRWKRLGLWVTSVLNPRDARVGRTLKPNPTVSRVRLDGRDPVATPPPYFDVIESYWSPIDKGKTTFPKLVAWLLRTVIVPLNTTARYMSGRGKTAYDVAFVSVALTFAVLFLLGALLAAAWGLLRVLQHVGTSGAETESILQVIPLLFQALSDPQKFAAILPPAALGVIAAGIAGAVLLVTGLKAAASMVGQRRAIAQRPAQMRERTLLIAGVVVAGLGLLGVCYAVPVGDGGPLRGWALLFVFAGVFLELGLTIGKSFFVNFFGDVQMYTTRDENSEFFMLRDEILTCVTTTIAHACSNEANGGHGYDRVYVLAHSLGSTIALDAVLRLANLAAQDPDGVGNALKRLRGFVTFGSPLEKTKYFTDVLDPSPSAARDQWRDDLYGSLFTSDVSVLDRSNDHAKAVFWGNYWYFADVIANELQSFRSFVPPGMPSAMGHHMRRSAFRRHARRRRAARARGARGDDRVAIGRRVCRNEKGHKGLQIDGILPHGDYLVDDWFWRTDRDASPTPHLGVLDVVARWAYPPDIAAARNRPFIEPVHTDPDDGYTYELVPPAEAAKYFDRATLSEDADAGDAGTDDAGTGREETDPSGPVPA